MEWERWRGEDNWAFASPRRKADEGGKRRKLAVGGLINKLKCPAGAFGKLFFGYVKQ